MAGTDSHSALLQTNLRQELFIKSQHQLTAILLSCTQVGCQSCRKSIETACNLQTMLKTT